jgi:hypothetical protein
MALNSVREHMVHEIRDASSVDRLKACGWIVVRLGQHPAFITSDAPLVVNAGMNSEPIQILAMALSPKCLFVFYPSWWPHDDEFGELLALLVQSHNYTLVSGPGRSLYSSARIEDSEEQPLRTAIERRFGNAR